MIFVTEDATQGTDGTWLKRLHTWEFMSLFIWHLSTRLLSLLARSNMSYVLDFVNIFSPFSLRCWQHLN